MITLEDAVKWQELLVSIRRELHMHPEPSMKEFETTKYIRRFLDGRRISWIPAGETGTVAIVCGNAAAPVIGLRGDIDALDVDEGNDVPYRSQCPGVMHACGHDGHTAALLCAAAYLEEHKSEIPAVVKLIFQPGEENGRGAESVVESGAVSDVDGIFALHVSSSIPTGDVTIRSGTMSSANDKFRIRINGVGCHGSTPQKGADALLAGASLVHMLQSVVSRESDPLAPTVMTIGIFRSGSAFNILPGSAYLEGSIRVLDEALREKNREAVCRMAEAAAAAYRCTAHVGFEATARIVYNDENLTDIARDTAASLLGAEHVGEQPLSLGAEDFASFLEVCPVTYMNIGSGNHEKKTDFPHHHRNFDMDEDALPICMAMYVGFAEKAAERLK